MTRENDRCAYRMPDGYRCAWTLNDHVRYPHGHAFEPARAEAPQGEARRCCACGVQCERPCNTETDSICEDCQCRPAARSETGGDEARDWLARHNEFRKCLGCELCFAYAAGRAAENEACEKLRGYRECEGSCVHSDCAALRMFKRAIAARRGSGT